MAVTDVTDDNFQTEVLDSEVPVLVDFWATYCAPCKALSPMVEALADEHGEALKVVKVDVQRNMRTALAYKVSNLPALLVFKGGEVVDRKNNAAGGLAALRKLVENHV